jgi:type IV secretory pathway protease TraF
MEKKDSFQELAKKMFPNPTQEVLETSRKVYIDGHPIDFVSEVKSESFGKDIVKVTVTFLVKSFKKEI